MNQKLTLVIASNDHGTLEELRAAFTKDDRIRVLATDQDVQKLHTDVARLRHWLVSSHLMVRHQIRRTRRSGISPPNFPKQLLFALHGVPRLI